MSVILGSESPRRRALLARLIAEFAVASADLDEPAVVAGMTDADDPAMVATALARAKHEVVVARFEGDGRPVLTGDTVVLHDGVVLGKPRDRRDAVALVRSMSFRSIEVVTALCCGRFGGDLRIARRVTEVRFGEVTSADAEVYVRSGEADDKAGGLALQGGAQRFVQAVDGCWTNVLGLPLCAVTEVVDAIPRQACTPSLCGAIRS